MTARHLRIALLLAAVPAAAATVAAIALKTSAWQLTASRHEIRLSPRPRKNCPDCKGAGGWWSEGPYPDGEQCWCWDRPEHTLRLARRNPWPDEPPF
uniref:hypothetical protein n=1 Tax=Streptomyces sp. NBC_01553 TaxID=2975877 RepID=UPI002F90958F